ncbi:MAG: septal ring lytic transglycosylase RlpA family protein [Microcystaceae cyanobacterium]
MNHKIIKTIALTTTTTLMGGFFWLGGSSLPNNIALSSNRQDVSASQTQRDGNALATTQTYKWKGKQATILRVKDIPVLTFVSPLEEKEAQHKAANLAQTVTNRLNQFASQGINADQITVAWDGKTKGYSIKIKDEELVQVNKNVFLPDTTNNLATDALQATNRLRRLMGNASPLTTVANLPQPQPTQVATAKSGNKNRAKGVSRGVASWYGPGFHGRRTANGERYNQHGLTAAHRYLPFGTRVRVTNLRNNRSVVVRINDRGPFVGGRIIDLSAGAAKQIGVYHSGVAPVTVEVLGR